MKIFIVHAHAEPGSFNGALLTPSRRSDSLSLKKVRATS